MPEIVAPNLDLRALPERQRKGPLSEQQCLQLLQASHETLWHAPAPEMMCMRVTMGLHPAVVKLAATIPKCCPTCRKLAKPLSRPMVKASLAARFNKQVFGDLFFRWEGTDLMLIDDALRYRVAVQMPG